MYKIYFYVPETHLEQLKNAIFAKGAGKFGNYDCCAWQTLGQGQFRALEGSCPTVGISCQTNRINEYKVETICEDHYLKQVVDTLLRNHPYEEPAYGIHQIMRHDDIT